MNANRMVAAPLVVLVRFYQKVLSPMTSPNCRFYPSCSSYAVTSLNRFGPLRGGWWAVRRIGRCHPWNPGGVDPVPQTWAGRYDVRPEDYRPAQDVLPTLTPTLTSTTIIPADRPTGGTSIGHDDRSTVNARVNDVRTAHQTTEELR